MLFNQDLASILQVLVAVALIILVSFPVHEFSHAWTAYKLGDSTARYQGRLTLDPRVHFDPIGGALLAISALVGVGIGWAKPTPVNPYNLRYGRRGESLVALSGPISNLILAAAVAIPLRLILSNPGLQLAVFANDGASFLLEVAFNFVRINILLMVFNLLPVPPLDGWKVLLGLLDARTAYTLRQFEQYGFVIIILIIVAAPTLIGNLVDPILGFLLGI
jgi:Zn-dependent protease